MGDDRQEEGEWMQCEDCSGWRQVHEHARTDLDFTCSSQGWTCGQPNSLGESFRGDFDRYVHERITDEKEKKCAMFVLDFGVVLSADVTVPLFRVLSTFLEFGGLSKVNASNKLKDQVTLRLLGDLKQGADSKSFWPMLLKYYNRYLLGFERWNGRKFSLSFRKGLHDKDQTVPTSPQLAPSNSPTLSGVSQSSNGSKVPLFSLVSCGSLKPGTNVMSLDGNHADLMQDGRIRFGSDLYDSPSGWARQVKGHAVNGWTAVRYKGVSLAQIRDKDMKDEEVSNVSEKRRWDTGLKPAGGFRGMAPPLAELVQFGVLKPGPKVLTLDSAAADLREDGRIQYGNELFESPSGWGRRVKGHSVNGWTAVKYKGKNLASYRDGKDGRGIVRKKEDSDGEGVAVKRRTKTMTNFTSQSLSQLVHRGVLEPGQNVLRIGEVTADLTSQGQILYEGRLFVSPSGWARYVRGRSINGWTSVSYKGTSLALYRTNDKAEDEITSGPTASDKLHMSRKRKLEMDDEGKTVRRLSMRDIPGRTTKIPLLPMLESGLLKPGKGVLTLDGERADLRPDGRIQAGGTVFESPSGWGRHVKNHSVNGWTVVRYKGSFLSTYRDQWEDIALGRMRSDSDDSPKKKPSVTLGPSQPSLSVLVATNVVTPGVGVLSIDNKYTADLTRDGQIVYGGEVFISPSGWARAVRGRSTNGWTSVFYNGNPLAYWRSTSRNESSSAHNNTISNIHSGTAAATQKVEDISALDLQCPEEVDFMDDEEGLDDHMADGQSESPISSSMPAHSDSTALSQLVDVALLEPRDCSRDVRASVQPEATHQHHTHTHSHASPHQVLWAQSPNGMSVR